jgi:S-DNA-T family DNA segregation ATPase FtsK/SpoIIIE
VPLRVYDETIRVLKSAVHAAKLGREEELGALRRLDAQARLLEQKASGPPVEELLADERDRSHVYEGGSGDKLYAQAVAVVCRERKASTSFVQRHLQIGYNRAARIIERMEAEGIVTAANHVGKREVLARGGE